MAEYHLTAPLTEEDVTQLKLGDTVYLSGKAFTCRSRLHRWVLDENHPLPKAGQERDLLIHEPIDQVVMHYAKTAKNAGLDGIVCSPLEAGKVHDTCGKHFLTITPGVRFADGDVGDQKRVMTPAAAKEIGSDYIVVGRPITAAEDPVAAYERCVAEFCD